MERGGGGSGASACKLFFRRIVRVSFAPSDLLLELRSPSKARRCCLSLIFAVLSRTMGPLECPATSISFTPTVLSMAATGNPGGTSAPVDRRSVLDARPEISPSTGG